jgi:hypothetical protein
MKWSITSERVRETFKGLETGDGAAFFKHVADDVDWIVEGDALSGCSLHRQEEGQIVPFLTTLTDGYKLNGWHAEIDARLRAGSYSLPLHGVSVVFEPLAPVPRDFF